MTPRQARIARGEPYVERDVEFMRMCAALESESYAWSEEELKTARTSFTPEEELQLALRAGVFWRADVRAKLGWPKTKKHQELTRARKRELVRAMWMAGAPVDWIREAAETCSSDIRKWCDDLPPREGSPRGLKYKRGSEHGNCKTMAQEKIDEMRRLRARGWGFGDIGLAVDVSHVTARKYCRDVVVERPAERHPEPTEPLQPPRPPRLKIDDERRARIREMYADGASLEQIAQACAVSTGSVRNFTHDMPGRRASKGQKKCSS